MYDKWKKAVIHLECATDSKSYEEQDLLQKSLQEKLQKGEIMQEEFLQHSSDGSRDLRYHGTALFITHKGRKYLLTARHVLYDEVCAERKYKEELDRCKSDSLDNISLQYSAERFKNQIFRLIFRVPSLNEVHKGCEDSHKEFLMNLSAGSPSSSPYTFSDENLTR